MTNSHPTPLYLYNKITRNLAAILAQHSDDARPGPHATALQCMTAIANMGNPEITDQAILACRGLIGLIDSEPLKNALASLEIDGVCGEQCLRVASTIDATSRLDELANHPANDIDP